MLRKQQKTLGGYFIFAAPCRDGCVQPLLVILQSVDDAVFLIKNARCRRSTDPVTRNSVDINPDLTKAEALTAYQRPYRCYLLAKARSSTHVCRPPSLLVTVVTAPEGAHSGGHASDNDS